MTDQPRHIIGVPLPEGYEIQHNEARGRDVLVMNTRQADWLARLMQDGARRAREEEWDTASTIDTLDDEGLVHMEEWRPVPGNPNVVVWTKPGAKVMVQNLDPGNLEPYEAYELALTLKEAAHYASRPTEETK